MWLETDPQLEEKVLSRVGVLSSRRLGGGLVNSVYYVQLRNGTSGVLRISDNQKESWIPRKERVILSYFQELHFFPKVISYGEINDLGVSFNLLSYFEADNMAVVLGKLSDKVFFDSGVVLGEIHSHTGTKFGFVYDFETIGADPRVNNSYPGPYKNGFEQHFIPAKGWVEHLVSKGSRFSEELERIITKMENQEGVFERGECTYNHGDYCFKNILTYPDRLIGIVDFDSFRFGDPASDIHHFLQNCTDDNVSRDSVIAFINGYTKVRPLPSGFYEKSRFYRCYQGVQKVISIPLRYRNRSSLVIERDKKKIGSFLQSLVDESDPCMNFKIFS